MQEWIVAQDVLIICGREMFDWRTLAAAVALVDYIPAMTGRDYDAMEGELTDNGLVAVLVMTRYRRNHHDGQRADLLDIMIDFRVAGATRARDHLFAFLGVVEAAKDPLLYPDYDEQFETVLGRYAKYLIGKYPEPMRLLYCATFTSQHPHFPSWIPNFITEPEYFRPFLNTMNNYQAGGRSKAKIRVEESQKELSVRGGLADSISILGIDVCGRGDIPNDHWLSFELSSKILRGLQQQFTPIPQARTWETSCGER